MPKNGIVALAVVFVLVVGSGATDVARAQDGAALRAELRLRESAAKNGADGAINGNFVLGVAVRGADTRRLASVGIALGDLDVTIPVRGGRFAGHIRAGGVDVYARVLAHRDRVTVRLQGSVRDGSGSVFGVRAVGASTDANRWDGTIYGLEAATVTIGDSTRSIPVGIAGRSDRKRRGDTKFDLAADDRYAVSLNALGRVAGADRARAEVQLVPRPSTDRWDGRVRGQVLISNADRARLETSLDDGEPVRVEPFDSEALDLSAPTRVSEGVVSGDFDGVTVTQIRFDAAVPALPGPHVVAVLADTADLQGSEVSREFEMPANDPPFLIDVDAHALEVRSDGVVRAWGDNRFGAVGNGQFQRNPFSPVPLVGPARVLSVGAGEVFSVAVDGDGVTWLWGSYDDDTPSAGSFPAVFPGLPPLVAIDAGAAHAAGLDALGRVWTFGRNGNGQLGDGTHVDRTREPLQVTGLPPIVAVAAGFETTVALDADGEVWTWGTQNLAGIGTGKRPVHVAGLPPIAAVDTRGRGEVGQAVSLALATDGTVWTWGGANPEDATPSRVQELRDVVVVAISCGGDHDLVLDEDGFVWARGINVSGQLGNGTRIDSTQFVQARDLSRIVQISAGFETSFAVDADGATWMWGVTSAYLGDWGTRTLPVLAPREFVPGSYAIPEEPVGTR